MFVAASTIYCENWSVVTEILHRFLHLHLRPSVHDGREILDNFLCMKNSSLICPSVQPCDTGEDANVRRLSYSHWNLVTDGNIITLSQQDAKYSQRLLISVESKLLHDTKEGDKTWSYLKSSLRISPRNP